jgi:membrane protein YqaA with SNARE-associated domain
MYVFNASDFWMLFAICCAGNFLSLVSGFFFGWLVWGRKYKRKIVKKQERQILHD